ncbi:hypothetical protein [Consotaella salsifontis]|uniref:Uncharacterized protein n=1 Tax=Consotaella salsifontis TaxID=1365950 RepID=A0A1T4QSY0_9HYPH|nr:hypothetical protein [Consotaella salsifontis]SKA06776.1 hypothetical protein SAMN05428963_105235 [Consotaella salsifontis]
MTNPLDAAIDHINQRAAKIRQFLDGLDQGQPVEKVALQRAIHDCINVTASLESLKRVVARRDGRQG